MTAKRLDGDDGLVEGTLTRSAIGSFYDVYRELGHGYREFIYALALERALVAKGHRISRPDATQQLFGYLCGTDLEVGLLLHFGKRPRFYRVVYENKFKHRRTGRE